MKIEGKPAPRRALRNTVLFSTSIGALFALSLIYYLPFVEKSGSFEQRSRQLIESLRSRVTGQNGAPLKRVADAPATLLTEVVNSQTSDIYPKLERARTALSQRARLDADLVWVSFLEKESDEIAVVEVTKQALRTRGAAIEIMLNDATATLMVDEPNGVNTKLSVKSEKNWMPFTLAYPIDQGGLRIAYYTPAHYQLRTPELVADGQAYINNHIVNGTAELIKAGYQVSPVAQEMAGKLSVVEHVDHARFVNEPPTRLFEEIYTLYALNRGETYRYSISVAGAGGMIQMIPSTYKMVRQRYPNANLGESFTASMADHAQAMKAMLLYIEMTYQYFQNNSIVAQAMDTTLARVNDLMAAGYNSNPARIPGYIDRGHTAWTRLLPRETNIYLSILHTLENPALPQVEVAREFLNRPSAGYHTATVRAPKARATGRYSSRMVASRRAGKYKVKTVFKRSRRR